MRITDAGNFLQYFTQKTRKIFCFAMQSNLSQDGCMPVNWPLRMPTYTIVIGFVCISIKPTAAQFYFIFNVPSDESNPTIREASGSANINCSVL